MRIRHEDPPGNTNETANSGISSSIIMIPLKVNAIPVIAPGLRRAGPVFCRSAGALPHPFGSSFPV
jgi:hypothetical protein